MFIDISKKKYALILMFSFLFIIAGCGSSSNNSDDDDDDDDPVDPPPSSKVSDYFPENIAVASPLNVAEDEEPKRKDAKKQSVPQYLDAIETINDILSGETPVADVFDPELFYSMDFDANCYGPKLYYENHPDGPTPTPPMSEPYASLPTGDLGIWNEIGVHDQGCAAAQLNARMKGIGDHNLMALMSMASLVAVAVDNGTTWPTDITAGTNLDLTTEMNALSIADTTFNSASVSLSATDDIWSYSINLTYNRNSTDYDVVVNLTHQPGATDDEFEGLLTFRVDDTFDPPGNCPNTDVTRNGSLHYITNSASDVRMQYRAGQLCGHGENGLSEAVDSENITGNVLSPSSSWANNFSIFTAEYDPENQQGVYSYVWQAGPNDSHSRTLLVGLEAELDSGAISGESYFGFGNTVTTTDGSIQGFICNWAGPNNSHTLLDYAQRQHLTQNLTTGWFEPSNAAATDMIYAPTNSCMYDGTGSFLYDRDLDNDLSDETAATVNVFAGETLELDLMSPSGDATTIWEHITTNRNYSLPIYPR